MAARALAAASARCRSSACPARLSITPAPAQQATPPTTSTPPRSQELLAALPRLRRLSLLRNWEVGDSQLARAAPHLSGVTSLDLRGTWVTPAGLRPALRQLRALARLALSPPAGAARDWADALAGAKGLRALTLSCNAYSGALAEGLRTLARLEVRAGCTRGAGSRAAAQGSVPDAAWRPVAPMPLAHASDLHPRSSAPARS